MEVRLSLEEAAARIAGALSPLGEEVLPLRAARGRVLARPVAAPLDQPPFHRSPLDGYALRAADTAGASPASPVRLEVVDKVFAGEWPRRAVGPGQAVRLMTGAPIPPGADCVIRQEDTDLGEERAAIFQPLSPGRNICRRGEDFRRGEVLLPAGTRLDSAALGVLAAAGLGAEDPLPLLRLPRTALLSTGDELAPPGAPLAPGRIYDANGPMLAARLAELGLPSEGLEPVGDEPQALAAALRGAAAAFDLVLTTGGVSVGERDALHRALPLAGAQVLFRGVAVKPGTPALFALLEGTPVLCLSGNPSAAAATFEVLARPALAALGGNSALLPLRAPAALAGVLPPPGRLRRLLRGRWDGRRVVLPAGRSPGQLRPAVGANCLADLPPGPLAEGQVVDVILL